MSFWVVVPAFTVKQTAGGEPVVLYLVEIGVQSVSGEKTRRTVLRRYSQFSSLATRLAAELGGDKALPPVPAKQRLARVNDSESLVEQRRKALEAWLWALLADVEVAHSAALTAFLELSAARRGLTTQQVAASPATPGGASAASPSPSPSPSHAPSEEGSGDEGSGAGATPQRAPADAAAPTSSSIALAADERASARRTLSALQQRYAAAKSDLSDAVACLRSDAAVKRLLAARVDELERVAAAPASQQPPAEDVVALAWQVEESKAALRVVEAARGEEAAARARAERRAEEAEQREQAARAECDAAAAARQASGAGAAEAEARASMERRVLAKEVKALRRDLLAAQAARDAALAGLSDSQAAAARTSAEQAAAAVRARLAACLRESGALRRRLADASVERLATESRDATDPLELLCASDSRTSALMAEAQLIGRTVGAQAGEAEAPCADAAEALVREALSELLCDAASLRVKVNSLLRAALGMAQREAAVRTGGAGSAQQSQQARSGPHWPWGAQA